MTGYTSRKFAIYFIVNILAENQLFSFSLARSSKYFWKWAIPQVQVLFQFHENIHLSTRQEAADNEIVLSSFLQVENRTRKKWFWFMD